MDMQTGLAHYFLDASALVKLVCDEPGSRRMANLKRDAQSPLMTSWVLVAEALGVLKRKWGEGVLGDADYEDRVQELLIYVKTGLVRVVDLVVADGEPRLRTYEVQIRDVRSRHPDLDAADALQFLAIKEGILGCYAGDSRPQLVSADKELLTAAGEEGIKTISVCHD